MGEHAKGPVNYTFTVGKLGVSLGSVVDIRVTRNEGEEQRQRENFVSLQDDILQMYGINSPSPPVLRLRNVTQTTVTLEWDPLQLANADLHSLDIVRNGQRIAKVPRPLNTTSTKLSGLSMDTEYTIQLVLYTSAGTFASDELQTKTHTLEDTSGIHVCLGSMNDPRLRTATVAVVESLGAQWTDQIQVDTTHLVTTHEPPKNAPETNETKMYDKALQLSIPIVQPHWLFACQDAKRMVNISGFYVDAIPPNDRQVREGLRAYSHDERARDVAPSSPEAAPATEEDTPAEPPAEAAPPSDAPSPSAAPAAAEAAPGTPTAPAASDEAPATPNKDVSGAETSTVSQDETLESEMENIAL